MTLIRGSATTRFSPAVSTVPVDGFLSWRLQTNVLGWRLRTTQVNSASSPTGTPCEPRKLSMREGFAVETEIGSLPLWTCASVLTETWWCRKRLHSGLAILQISPNILPATRAIQKNGNSLICGYRFSFKFKASHGECPISWLKPEAFGAKQSRPLLHQDRFKRNHCPPRSTPPWLANRSKANRKNGSLSFYV